MNILINNILYKAIPYGYCACGCGQKTSINISPRKNRNITKGMHSKFIHGHHRKLNPFNNKGKTVRKGYVLIFKPDHPGANKNGYISEHILIAEKSLNMILPKNVKVHHVNGSKSDNRPGNLVVCQDQAYHMLLHQRERAYKECGHASWRKCKYCQQYDNVNNLVVRNYNNRSMSVHHKDCKNQHDRKKREVLKAVRQAKRNVHLN